MKIYVAVTDEEWLQYLAQHSASSDTVNFWRPGQPKNFKAIGPGDLMLFKRHAPHDSIGGGGFFHAHRQMPLSMAWQCFAEGNGTASFAELQRKIWQYRRRHQRNDELDPIIGCTLLNQPVFFPNDHFATRDFAKSIVQGKSYDVGTNAWHYYYREWEQRLYRTGKIPREVAVADSADPVHPEMRLIAQRLGQGAFRADVMENCKGACVVTGERAIPVLDAAHIRPYTDSCDNSVDNGILLRADIHRLYDNHMASITPDHVFRVNEKLLDYGNGRQYLAMDRGRIAEPKHQLNEDYLHEHYRRFEALLDNPSTRPER